MSKMVGIYKGKPVTILAFAGNSKKIFGAEIETEDGDIIKVPATSDGVISVYFDGKMIDARDFSFTK